MVKLYNSAIYLMGGREIIQDNNEASLKIKQITGKNVEKGECRKGTIAYSILKEHNTSDNMAELKLKFDSLTNHDITYVGIIQTAIVGGLKKFPLPYVLPNCHNPTVTTPCVQ